MERGVVLMALSKRKNDIKFFNLETGEVVCTFNQCLHKFTVTGSHDITRTPIVGMDVDNNYIRSEVVSKTYFHQCSECGRKVSDKEDKNKFFNSYMDNKYRPSNKKDVI
jgi:hypothetical protein